MKVSKKLKTLALILRSLPPKSQQAILEQLPPPVATKIIALSESLDDDLTDDDWDYFYSSWPEFGGLIEHVKVESKNQKINDLMLSERDRVRDFLDYKLGLKKERPNLSNSVAKIINKMAIEH